MTMLLRWLPHSPYARKVTVFAHEVGLTEAIEVEESHPFDYESPLHSDNPIGKVPVLVRAEGGPLYDSTVICQYLDTLHDGARRIPAEGEALWQALRRNALGDGLGQAATWNIRERYRPDGERSPSYQKYYERTIDRCLAALEAEAGEADPDFGLGEISIACALSYLDFRYPERGWRKTYPAVGTWFDGALERPSMKATPLGPYSGPLQP